MPKWLVFVLVLLLIPSIANPKGQEIKRKAGEYETEVKIDRYPPVLGDNRIEIEIKDAGGKLITDAKVLVNYYMPPMPRMAPMNYSLHLPPPRDLLIGNEEWEYWLRPLRESQGRRQSRMWA